MKHSEGFLKLVNDAKSRIREVTVDGNADNAWLPANGVRLIDVREDSEWEAGARRRARHISAKASSNATSNPPCQTSRPK